VWLVIGRVRFGIIKFIRVRVTGVGSSGSYAQLAALALMDQPGIICLNFKDYVKLSHYYFYSNGNSTLLLTIILIKNKRLLYH
jgi:hypothetical protein